MGLINILRHFFLAVTLVVLSGCTNLAYFSKLGWYQGAISSRSLPVQEVLEDRQVDDGAKEKIRFVQEVKRYGEERLGLQRTKSYSKFVEVKGPVLHVVTACDKDRLQLQTWDFPIVGKVTYKGFFTREDAEKEGEALEAKGYDICVQPAGAYSTLGWLKDPIFSSMLKWSDPNLANLILHEMTHSTVYLKDRTDFNEQVATFIGNQGTINFLEERYGSGSEKVAEAIQTQKDEALFSSWINRTCERLSGLYAQEISRDEKMRRREEIFQTAKQDFRAMEDQFKTGWYKGFERRDLNNAVLLAHRRYFHRLELLERLYGELGHDLRKMVRFLKEIRPSGEDPSAFLERWIREKG
jgi:predicted aminopeptidase